MDLEADGRKLVAEFVGPFVLVFAGVGAIVLGGDLVAVALAHGLAIALMISALGHISGGHYNPAVTLGFWATRRIATPLALAYIVAQLAGATVAALAIKVLVPSALTDISNGVPALAEAVRINGQVIQDTAVSMGQGIAIEAVLTFFLVTSIFGTAVALRGARIGGFGIGLTITMDILAAGALTGAAMNPARSFGPALAFGAWDDQIVYWVGPIIGAIVAALVFHYVFMDREEQVATSG